MRCPHCDTENRDDRATCYHCGRDLTMLRLIVNKAKQHFNNAVEHAEQHRYYEALGELNNALELNSRFQEALVLRGTILARLERFEEAQEAWTNALQLDPQATRAHRYLDEMEDVREASPLLRRVRTVVYGASGVAVLCLLIAIIVLATTGGADANNLRAGWSALYAGDLAESRRIAIELDDADARAELLKAIDVSIQTRLDSLTALALAGDYPELRKTLGALEEMQLPEKSRESFVRTRGQVLEILRQEIGRQIAGRPMDVSRMAHVDELLSEYAMAFPADQDTVAYLREDLKRALNDQLEAILAPAAPLLTEPDRSVEVGQVLSNALAFVKSVPADLRPLVDDSLVLDYSSTFGDTLFRAALAAVEDNDLRLYDQYLTALRNMPVLDEKSVAEAEGLRALLREREQRVLLASLQTHLHDGAHRQAVTAADQLADLGFPIPPAMKTRLEQARQALAVSSYYQLMEMADRIDAGALNEDEAREVLRLVFEARGPLPARLRIRADENITHFAAQAHGILGEEEAREAELDTLRAQFPNSPYLAPSR